MTGTNPAPNGDLELVRHRNPTWVIVHNENSTYTARRDWWGNQQILTVPTLAELDATLQALDQGAVDSQPCTSEASGITEGAQPQ
jgi:hypothetical protein